MKPTNPQGIGGDLEGFWLVGDLIPVIHLQIQLKRTSSYGERDQSLFLRIQQKTPSYGFEVLNRSPRVHARRGWE